MDSLSDSNLKAFTTSKVCGLLGLLMTLVASNSAFAVIIDGRDWRQPLDTVGFSYETIATACDINTGACNGSVQNTNGPFVDLTGWTWADALAVWFCFDGPYCSTQKTQL